MRKNVLALVVVLASAPFLLHESARAQTAGASGQPLAKAPAAKSLKSRFVGAWKLVSIETRNAKGEVVPPAAGAGNRTGYIIYDPAGYVAVSIMPASRKRTPPRRSRQTRPRRRSPATRRISARSRRTKRAAS